MKGKIYNTYAIQKREYCKNVNFFQQSYTFSARRKIVRLHSYGNFLSADILSKNITIPKGESISTSMKMTE
mgnify:CR=1 FL=1